MSEARVSVCTIARGRSEHLASMMRGLAKQAHRPTELVIGCMASEPYSGLPSMPFPVRQIEVPGDPLPLAAARNACVEAATGSTLIFLDVDCIPGPDLVAGYRNAVATGGGCIIGDTRYLAEGEADDDADFERLWRRAEEHPARAFRALHGKGVHAIADHGEFWSLSFALSRKSFARAGGFDEAFVGYGGEDTDFAMRLARAGVALFWSSRARAVHQWHAVQVPPLDHLPAIVRNANLFAERHGRLCMDYWLGQLAQTGFVRLDGMRVQQLREPTAEERVAARQDGSVRFS